MVLLQNSSNFLSGVASVLCGIPIFQEALSTRILLGHENCIGELLIPMSPNSSGSEIHLLL